MKHTGDRSLHPDARDSEVIDTAIEIMGKTYYVKCREQEISALKRAAQYLEEKMRLARAAGVLSVDRLAVITALNIAHEFLALEQKKNSYAHFVSERVNELGGKVEHALLQAKQMELQPVE